MNYKKDLEPAGEQMTLFSLAGSHNYANLTHSQENEKAKKMNAIYGQKCLEQLEQFDHVGLWAKMFSALLIGMEGWFSTKCKLTWKLRGTKYGRMYFQLAPSTLPTEETEYGLLQEGMMPTPTTRDWKGGLSEASLTGSKGIKFGMTVPDYVKKILMPKLLPTPTAMDSTGATANMKSTQVKEGSMHSVTLSRLLCTPTTRDWKGARTSESLKAAGRNETNSLPDTFHQPGKTSQLNPRFVAEMMGFPPNWTELPFLSGETNPSKPTATQ